MAMLADIGQWTSVLRDVLLGAAAAATATFAYLGLSSWRKELKGKSEYQLAKDVLKAIYKVREAFKIVRNPAVYSYEYPDDMINPHGHLKREYEYEGVAHVYQKRWEKMAEAFQEIEDLHLDAQVEWGPEYQDVIRKLRRCRVDLQIAIQTMLERKKDPRVGEATGTDESAEERSVLYNMGEASKHDKFTPEIAEAIDEFEKWLRPKIKR